MYNFKSIIQIQDRQGEDIITINISIGRHKVRINVVIKRLKKTLLILLFFCSNLNISYNFFY